MRHDLGYWIALTRFPKFGPIRLAKLANYFPSMKEAFEASVTEFTQAQIEPNVAEAFLSARATLDPVKELERLAREGLSAITMLDDAYPAALKTLHAPPAVLYIRGTLPSAARPHLAVVGSRHATAYGIDATKAIIGPLARSGVVIVSGLAYGIDAHAHMATLEAEGATIAVLGSGVDEASVYPSQHRTLASRIVAGGGAVLSEFPPGTPSLPQHFPIRNRVISGLSRATLVIEATEKSGSLITARAALEQGRDVFAVPGPIHSPLSSGPHNLIKMGAACVTSADDVLHALGLASAAAPISAEAYHPENPDETALYNALNAQPQHADDLADSTGLPSPRVSSLLTLLEMKGAVRGVGGMCYVKAR